MGPILIFQFGHQSLISPTESSFHHFLAHCNIAGQISQSTKNIAVKVEHQIFFLDLHIGAFGKEITLPLAYECIV